MRQIGSLLIVGGAAAVAAGLAVRFGLFSWFGNLPGDIRRTGEGSTVFIPITSAAAVSVVLTVLVNLAGRIFRG